MKTKGFFNLKLEGQSEARTRNLRLSKQAALTTASGFQASPFDSPNEVNELTHL